MWRSATRRRKEKPLRTVKHSTSKPVLCRLQRPVLRIEPLPLLAREKVDCLPIALPHPSVPFCDLLLHYLMFRQFDLSKKVEDGPEGLNFRHER
ncbi:hypothetical protein GJ744_005778 [Endocarpon pusillum]|uniref:Uncharacterized protein n=1 Tax=Endocarpon pusillum TaxID=364733 RepID=A0A8H7AKW8_9EURO|nr:hypothetical protein GJ744_005778 [Endocarpon pusillum]